MAKNNYPRLLATFVMRLEYGLIAGTSNNKGTCTFDIPFEGEVASDESYLSAEDLLDNFIISWCRNGFYKRGGDYYLFSNLLSITTSEIK